MTAVPGVDVEPPLALLAELTHRCPLRCPYCSNPLELSRASGELDTATWGRVFDEAAALGVLQVHFSGGEPLARRDLVEHAVYLAAERGEELAERFLSQAEASCALLLDQPEIGSPLVVRDPALVGIRKWPVKDFESFLIFYVPHERGVTIVRVLYGRRDWWQLLEVI